MSKVVPDEFRVVTKAPLVVPPDYACARRPPASRARRNCSPKAPPVRP
jgi:hypothetical protein